MADITFEDGGGNQRTVPEWATESTLKRLVETLSNKKTKEEQKTLTQRLLNLNDNLDNLSDDLDEVGKSFKNSAESVTDKIGDLIGNTVGKVLGVALLTVGTAATVVTNRLKTLGLSLNSLSQSGLALERGTLQQLSALNEFGLSTDDATKFMLENAQAFRSMGNTASNQVVKSFLEITRQGNDLGMGLGDTIQFLGDELTLRTQLLNLGALDINQRRQMSQDLEGLALDQLSYSKALGVSTDVQREFAATVLGNNQMLMANLIRISSESRSQVFTGIQSFLSGMRAMGGEVGGEIAEAVLEAASMGAVGFSDAAFGFIRVLPGLADNMQSVIADFEAGIIDGSEAAMSFTQELGNLSQGEKDRVFLLARAGDEQAKSMAKAITQFETSAARMEEQGTSIENVQEGFNAFNTILKKLKGTLDSVVNNFMDGFGEGIGDVTEMMTNFGNEIQNILLKFFGLGTEIGDTSSNIQKLGKRVGKGLNDFLVAVVSWVDGFFGAFDEDDSVMDKFSHIATRAGEALVDGIVNLIPWGKLALSIAVGFGAILLAMKLQMAMFGGGAAGGGGGAGLGAAKLGRGIGIGLKGIGRGMAGLAAGSVGIPVLLALTAAIIGIGFALKLAAPGIKAFGEAIKSVFEGIAAVVKSVGDSIANIIEKVGSNKVAKINARSEAALKSTQATTAAIKELDGAVDAPGLMAMGESIDFLGGALGNFASQMSPTLLSSLRQGVAGLFGADSPVEQVLAMSANADPVKIMDLAKATMATNAANSGATSLDSSLQAGTETTLQTNNNTTNTVTNSTTNQSSNDSEILNLLLLESQKQTTKLTKAVNKLSDISNKT